MEKCKFVEKINDFVEDVRFDEYNTAVLLGMAGSSLAPEVFRKAFGVRDGYLGLYVLDSTDTGAVIALGENPFPSFNKIRRNGGDRLFYEIFLQPG